MTSSSRSRFASGRFVRGSIAVIVLALAGASWPAAEATSMRPWPGITEQRRDDDWPQLLGPRRNATSSSVVAPWPGDGPALRWRRDVGEGFAGPVVVDERLVLFHRRSNEEIVEALDTAGGRTLWSTAYATSYRDDFGFDEGPRATPTIAGGRVFSFGAQGVLQALDLDDGGLVWRVDTHAEFGVRKGFFGAACSPLVHEGIVMVNVGGPSGAGIVGFAADSGAVLWTVTDDAASYSAPVMAALGGRATALFFTREGLVSLDPANGEVFARFRWRSRSGSSVNAATPLIIGERIFISASYGTGAALLDVGTASFQPVWSSDDVLTNHYATSVYRDGFLYGYHGRQEYGPALRAIEAASGEVAWTEERFGGGTLILAADRLLILREHGELVLAEATPEAYRPLARAQILGGIVRAYPALAGQTLYARSEREMVAVELPAR